MRARAKQKQMRRVFLLIVKLCCAAGFVTGAYAADLTPNQRLMVERGKEVVARSLLDPSSVQWRNLYIRGIMLCGEVNAKNAYGGYVGFRQFNAIASPTGFGMIEPAGEDNKTRAAFRAICDSAPGPSVAVPSQ